MKVETGFLVGSNAKTVISEMLSTDESPTMILADSNIDVL
jgi:hypothetical protein